MQHATPAAPAVRETLERLLASETFRRSERARKLLCYLVEREQAGEADRLKGFAIAVDVFGKDTDFDSATDAVVRVQAGRLRDLLHQYFATEGAAEPIRIVIARGSYVPTYEPNAAPIESPIETRSDATSDSIAAMPPETGGVEEPGVDARLMNTPSVARQLRYFWAAIALVIAMLSALLLRQGGLAPEFHNAVAVEASVATSSIVKPAPSESLPLVYIAVKAGGDPARRVAAALRTGMSGFDTIDFIGRDLPDAPDPAAGATSFIFDVLPGPTADGVTLELQNVLTGRVLLSRSLSAEETLPPRIDDRIAGILTLALPASGTIYNYTEQYKLQTGLTECLLLGEKYYQEQNATTHETAYRCFQRLADHDAKSPLVYSELASLHLEAVTDRYPYPPDATTEQASTLAHRAIQMGSTSPSAHRAYGYLNSRLGNSEASIRWMRKAYELNTYDLGMAAAYGYGLIFAGQYSVGTPVIARAVEASSAHPTWWDFGLFSGEFMLGNSEMAARASDALASSPSIKSHYLAARLISASTAKNEELASELRSELIDRFPKFAADPRQTFVERNYPADLTNRLVEALHEAGLGNGS